MPHSDPPKLVRLTVPAFLELDADSFDGIAAFDEEEFRGIMFELLGFSTPVSLDRGEFTVRGKVTFIVPSPDELKKAWKAARGEA